VKSRIWWADGAKQPGFDKGRGHLDGLVAVEEANGAVLVEWIDRSSEWIDRNCDE